MSKNSANAEYIGLKFQHEIEAIEVITNQAIELVKLRAEITALKDAARALAGTCQTFMIGDVVHRVFEPAALEALRGLLDGAEGE